MIIHPHNNMIKIGLAHQFVIQDGQWICELCGGKPTSLHSWEYKVDKEKSLESMWICRHCHMSHGPDKSFVPPDDVRFGYEFCTHRIPLNMVPNPDSMTFEWKELSCKDVQFRIMQLIITS